MAREKGNFTQRAQGRTFIQCPNLFLALREGPNLLFISAYARRGVSNKLL